MEREVFKADWENGSRALLTFPSCRCCAKDVRVALAQGSQSSAANSAACPWLQVTFRGCFLHLSPESCLSAPSGVTKPVPWKPGNSVLPALVRGGDEQGQWHVKPWPGPSNVNLNKATPSVRLSITSAHNGSEMKGKSLPLQQAAAFDGCSQGTGKK